MVTLASSKIELSSNFLAHDFSLPKQWNSSLAQTSRNEVSGSGNGG